MTEVVHCKSRKEKGVSRAALRCAELHMDSILAASPADLVVVLGAKARDRIAPTWQLPPEFGTKAAIGHEDLNLAVRRVGGRNRVIAYLWHPTGMTAPKQFHAAYPRRLIDLRSLVAGTLSVEGFQAGTSTRTENNPRWTSPTATLRLSSQTSTRSVVATMLRRTAAARDTITVRQADYIGLRPTGCATATYFHRTWISIAIDPKAAAATATQVPGSRVVATTPTTHHLKIPMNALAVNTTVFDNIAGLVIAALDWRARGRALTGGRQHSRARPTQKICPVHHMALPANNVCEDCGHVPDLHNLSSKPWETRIGQIETVLSYFGTTCSVNVRRPDDTVVYLQARRGAEALEIEAIGNHYLPTGAQLDASQIRHMIELGWDRPDLPDLPNLSLYLPKPNDVHALAVLMARSFAEVYGIRPDYEWGVTPVEFGATGVAAPDPERTDDVDQGAVPFTFSEKSTLKSFHDQDSESPLEIASIDLSISEAIETATRLAYHLIKVDVVDGWVELASPSGATFGRAMGDQLRLRLRRLDAELEDTTLYGEIEDIGAADVVDLVLAGRALSDQAHIDRAAILVVRAAHLAAGNHPAPGFFDIDDLSWAIMRAHEYADGPEDMRDYWSARLAVMRDLFGLAAERLAATKDPHTWHREMYWETVGHVAADVNTNMHPFRRFHERPAEMVAATNGLSNRLGEIEDERRTVGRQLIRELLVLIDPSLELRTIPTEDLLAQGVALSPPRDQLQLDMDDDF